MKPYQFVGYVLLNTTAVTAIVGQRVVHGSLPSGSAWSTLAEINYFELGSGLRFNGVGSKGFSINCRASDPGSAQDLAEAVVDAFHGSAGSGLHGTMNGFDVARASLRNLNGLVPEPDTNSYNVPVDITLVYPLDTVS